MSKPAGSAQSQTIQDEIAELERRLENAKARLNEGQVSREALSTQNSDGKKDFLYVQIAC
jgi:prefoldin subunit 5